MQLRRQHSILTSASPGNKSNLRFVSLVRSVGGGENDDDDSDDDENTVHEKKIESL